jgi:hypothetical protein
MLAQLLGVHRDPDGVGDRDGPVPGDVVFDVDGPHGGKGEVERGDQRHHGRERQRERVGQRHGVAEAQTCHRRVFGHIGTVDGQPVDGQRPGGQAVAAGDHR